MTNQGLRGRIARFLVLGLRPNLRLYLTAVPLVLLASVGSYVSPGELELSLWYLLANVLSLVFVALVFFLGSAALGKLSDYNQGLEKPRFVISSLLAFGFGLGLAKQLSTAWILVLFSIEESLLSAVLMRSLTPLLGVWYVLALAVITAAQVRFSSLREELIAERVRKLAADETPDHELREFASRAQELLQTASDSDAKAVASLIRSIVQDQLRPLSHRLWDREQNLTPGFSTRELAIRALQYRPYRVWRILLLYSLGSVAPMVFLAGSDWWLAFLILAFSTAAVLHLANFIRRRSDFAKEQFVLSLVLTALGATLGSLGLLFALGFESSFVLWLASSWWLGTLMVVVGMFVVALEDYSQQRRLLAELADSEISSAALGSVQAIRNRELANLLHAKTQNRMLAQAMRLEAGGDLAVELAELRRLLAQLPAERTERLSTNELVARWDGILNISFSLDREPDQLILRVCEEAISNALRHGLATEVFVTLKNDLLTISDNGLGPVDGKPGLGSTLYSSAGDWELAALEHGGAQLLVRFS